MDWLIVAAIATVVVPLLGWILHLQGRLTKLESWQEFYTKHWEQFEGRVTRSLDRIEAMLQNKADK